MKKILITGASGYLGSNFIKSYSKEFTFKKFSLLKESISSLDLNEIDVVLHCAALVHKTKDKNYSYEDYFKVNVNYPLELALEAKKNRVKQFIYVSSISVYGEENTILNLNTPKLAKNYYGRSKLEAEKRLNKLNDEYFKVSIIRPPMIYGSEAPGNIKSLVKLIKILPFIPLGGINNKRSFISIDNLNSVIKHIIISSCKGVFLVSDDEPIGTSDLMLNIAKGINKKIVLIKVPLLKSILKLIKPNLYKKLYTNLIVDNYESNNILNYKTPNTVYQELKKIIK